MIELRAAASRFCTTTDWLTSYHSFSFGGHYDPANTRHGVLVVNNEDELAPYSGYDTHAHREMEIVTWVLEGSLLHEDSAGHRRHVGPGVVQRVSAGSGILHAEKNDDSVPVRFVQMWVLPSASGGEPDYAQRDVGALLRAGELVPLVSGRRRHDAALPIAQEAAVLHGARLPGGAAIELPEAPHVHVFVTRGEVSLEGAGVLCAGDAARLTGEGARAVTGVEPAEILVWEMHD